MAIQKNDNFLKGGVFSLDPGLLMGDPGLLMGDPVLLMGDTRPSLPVYILDNYNPPKHILLVLKKHIFHKIISHNE